MIFKSTFLLAGFVIASLASCDDSDHKNHSETANPQTEKVKNSSKTACSLLLADDVEKILGNAVSQGMNTPSMCQYLSTSEELSKTGESVSLTLHQGAASEFEKYVSDTESSTNTKTEPVDGVGGKAAWADGSLIIQQKNDLLVIIVGRRMEKTAHIEAAKNLAQKIIGRM